MWTGIIVLHKITHPTLHFVYTFISHNNSNDHVTSTCCHFLIFSLKLLLDLKNILQIIHTGVPCFPGVPGGLMEIFVFETWTSAAKATAPTTRSSRILTLITIHTKLVSH